MKRLALIMAVGAIALLAAGPAYGQGAVGDTYGGQGNDALPTIQESTPPEEGGTAGDTATSPVSQVAVTNDSESSLPFTGLDVGLLLIGGLALVGVGVGLRRFARPLT